MIDTNSTNPDANPGRPVDALLAARASGQLLGVRPRKLPAQARLELKQSSAVQYAEIISRSLDQTRVAHEVANELHRLLPGSRVSVAVVHGARARLLAISNVQQFSRQSVEVKAMERLASLSALTRLAVWRPDSVDGQPPQIRLACHAYEELAHPQSLAVIPLATLGDDPTDPNDLGRLIRDKSTEDGEVVAVLILEGLEHGITRAEVDRQLQDILRLTTTALSNARRHSSLPLMPLWRAAGDFVGLFRGHRRRTATLAASAFVAVMLLLCLVPGDLRMRCNGVIQPVSRSRVFAEVDGVIETVQVQEGEYVRQGQLLLTLDNPLLKAEIIELAGLLAQTREKLVASKLERVTKQFDSPAEKRHAVLETAGLQATVDSLERQHSLLLEKQARLEVRSPADGQVITWDLRRRLLGRPVQLGQRLLEVSDTAGDWELELRLPDSRASRLRRLVEQQRGADDSEPTQATYVLASHPSAVRRAEVTHVARSAVVHEKDGNVVLVSATVAEAPQDSAAVRSGTEVVSHIHVGKAPIGYCKLHEFFAWCRRMWFSFA